MAVSLRALLQAADAVSPRTLLWINAAFAVFVGLAHGGALALTYSQPVPKAQEIRHLASISLPIVAIVMLTAIGALVVERLRPKALALHGAALAIGTGALITWAIGILLDGLPEGRFHWSVGLLSLTAAYSAHILSRFSLPESVRSVAPIYYSPLIALVLVVPIDVGVFLRAVS